MPRFTAEASLAPASGCYIGEVSHAVAPGLMLQGWPLPNPNPGGQWPPPVFPNGRPYDPIGEWPTKPPPGWKPPLPPEPPVAPPPIAGGGAVGGGSILTTPIELGLGGTILVGIGAVGAGILIGWGLGRAVEKALTPPPPTPATPTPGCARVGPNTQHMITGSYWGCERSWNKTMQDADADCKSRAGICSGTCPSGAPCTPYANVYDSAQIPGVFACDTSLYYTCECGC